MDELIGCIVVCICLVTCVQFRWYADLTDWLVHCIFYRLSVTVRICGRFCLLGEIMSKVLHVRQLVESIYGPK
jgi:hypothetical protein